LICLDINSFKLFKSFAPKFFAKLSSIFVSSGFFTAVILHSKTADLLATSFSGKFSGSLTSTFLSCLFLTPSNCLSNPLINKSFPSSN